MDNRRKLDFVIEHSEYLSEWEQGFIDDLDIRASKIDNYLDSLSFRQWQVLNRIFHKVETIVG